MHTPTGQRALTVTVRAPAKVNFSLQVTGSRADGYHFVDSIVAAVDLYDEIEVAIREDGTQAGVSLHLESPFEVVRADPSNLAWRAAARFLEITGRDAAIRISLRKRIPPGSGLGGASSDAAAVLQALNLAFPANLSPPDLATLGAALGSDVPFFLGGSGVARMQGIGEVLTSLPSPECADLVICWDCQPLATGEVYAQFDLALTSKCSLSNIGPFIEGRASWLSILSNDLEVAAIELRSGVAAMKNKLLEEGALGAVMTGSGSAVVGIWPSRPTAAGAASRLVDQGYWAVAARTLMHLPSPRIV